MIIPHSIGVSISLVQQ